MKKYLTILASTIFLMSPLAYAQQMEQGYYITQTEGEFSDVEADMQNAIINNALVIDYVGQVGNMLERTQETVGTSSPYANATYMQFCSAKHTHAAVANRAFSSRHFTS